MTQSASPNHAYWTAGVDAFASESTIVDAIRTAAERFSDRIALVDGSLTGGRRQWTYSELLAASESAASALLKHFNPGDRVAIWAPNRPEWIIAEFGMALAGLTLVTVNPAYLDDEVKYVLRQSRARGVLVEPIFKDRDLLSILVGLKDDLPELEHVLSIADLPTDRADKNDAARLPVVHPGDPAQIQYTSGTTGFPKGALLSHLGLVTNGRLYAEAIGAQKEDVWINPMPLFHTAGCGLVTLGVLHTGGTHVLPSGFEPSHMLALFEKERGTIMLSVPTMLTRMLDHPNARTCDLTSWRLVTLGGAPVAPELVRRGQEELNLEVGIGFGQTEASPYITHTRHEDKSRALFETIGQPLPGFDVKIIDQADGTMLRYGEIGEICARGPCVMIGYFENDAATSAAIDADGWLHTGDLGTMDDQGYCRVFSRLKDMIIRGGENVYPREVEDVLITHPAIAAVAVIGVPDSDLGESVAAAIQLHSGQHADKQGLEAFCSGRLASYKIPRTWRVVDHFPQTGSGKIQKFRLREEFLDAGDEGLLK